MRICVSGASVAGLGVAHWLHRYGHDVTVVERAPGIRPGGAAVDFRGAALGVLDRMGLLTAVTEHQTHMGEVAALDADGVVVATLPPQATAGEVEILKSDLTRILYEIGAPRVHYLFDDSITTLDQHDDGVRVGFRNAGEQTFDLVVGADGLHSNVRRLAFGPESAYVHHLGIYGALFTSDNFLGLDRSGVLYNSPGKNVLAFAARDNSELRVGLSFTATELPYDRHDTAEQRGIIRRRFAGDGWQVQRLLTSMDTADDFFFDSSSQVRMTSWSTGRVVLVGDAAYCAAPTSGRGTSQALIGAYVLAGELATATDHSTAFAAYEEKLRGYVAHNQQLGRDGAKWYFQPPSQETVANLATPADYPLRLAEYPVR
ncbi:FAD-dependent monooxygenase [Fodinicola acaciae]|uniref:FAD-dependent monooxygenase n=1 Tax=Fodinicola acaciae TaxID=2681555 RepID=UPI0013D76F89|nr:FAD-dependent monooxygenase [Fodinicola acaciae]